jgi:hypothetical protein
MSTSKPIGKMTKRELMDFCYENDHSYYSSIRWFRAASTTKALRIRLQKHFKIK